MLAAATLTRHVGIALAVAVVVDLLSRGRRASAWAAGVTAVALVAPWAAWLATVRQPTQAGLLTAEGLPARVVGQGVFYLRRLPDALTGPVVEIGTTSGRHQAVAAAVTAWAALATGVIVLGWARTLRTPRRRLAGLSALVTLALLLVWPFLEAGRFLIPLVPCLLVGAVEGLAAVTRRTLRPRRPRVAAAALVLAVSLPYPVYALATGRAAAQRRTNAGFDAACRWLRFEASRPGPVLTRHPGDVYGRTGRRAVAPDGVGPEAVARALDRWGAVYLLDDGARYLGAPASPIAAFARAFPDRVRAVWSRADGPATVRVYEAVSGPGPRSGAGRNPRSGGSSVE